MRRSSDSRRKRRPRGKQSCSAEREGGGGGEARVDKTIHGRTEGGSHHEHAVFVKRLVPRAGVWKGTERVGAIWYAQRTLFQGFLVGRRREGEAGR